VGFGKKPHMPAEDLRKSIWIARPMLKKTTPCQTTNRGNSSKPKKSESAKAMPPKPPATAVCTIATQALVSFHPMARPVPTKNPPITPDSRGQRYNPPFAPCSTARNHPIRQKRIKITGPNQVLRGAMPLI